MGRTKNISKVNLKERLGTLRRRWKYNIKMDIK
jgi:hypothetical protein